MLHKLHNAYIALMNQLYDVAYAETWEPCPMYGHFDVGTTKTVPMPGVKARVARAICEADHKRYEFIRLRSERRAGVKYYDDIPF